VATDPIVAQLDISERVLTSLSAFIKAQIENTFLDKIPGVDIIARTIENELTKAEAGILNAEKAIKTQIEPKLQGLVPDAIAIATSLASSLDTSISKLINNIATTEDVLGSAITVLKQHAPQLAQWIFSEVAGGFGATALNVLKEIETQGTGGIDAALDHLLEIPNAPPYFVELTKSFRNRSAEWQALALPALAVAILIGALEASQEPFQTALRQDAFSLLPTKEAEPSVLTDLILKQGITEDEFRRRMRNNGYNNDVADLYRRTRYVNLDPETLTKLYLRGEIPRDYFEQALVTSGYDLSRANLINLAAMPLLGPEEIRSAYLRGIYTAEQHDKALGQYGFTPDRTQLMRKLYFYIPPVPDIIHMGIRNVFNPEIVTRFNLLGDYPAAFENAAAQQGVSKEWAEKYWEAHWIVPGRSEAFEMFQRTTDKPLDDHADKITLEDGSEVYNIIGRDTLNLLLREVDTPPFYRDKVTQVAYRPLTRIDIRRLNKVGLLSKSGVERAYLDLGYTQAHARLLADFTERLNATVTKDAAQSLVTSLQRKVIELYVADKLSLDQVKSTLTDLGFTDAEIAVFTAEADLVHESEYVTAIESGIGKLYVAGLITDKDAIKRMQDAGIPIDAQTTLFAKWDLAIEYRGGSDHIVKHRELTKGEVLTSLADGLIDESTTKSMLEAMGYDKNGADAEIGLTLYKATRATKRAQIDSIKASFVNGVIEQLETSNRLDALFVPSDQRDAYIAEWTLARETRTERIPIATLRDMFKGSYIDEPTTLTHLKRHRFTDDDALLLVKFWAQQPAPKGLKSVSGT